MSQNCTHLKLLYCLKRALDLSFNRGKRERTWERERERERENERKEGNKNYIVWVHWHDNFLSFLCYMCYVWAQLHHYCSTWKWNRFSVRSVEAHHWRVVVPFVINTYADTNPYGRWVWAIIISPHVSWRTLCGSLCFGGKQFHRQHVDRFVPLNWAWAAIKGIAQRNVWHCS